MPSLSDVRHQAVTGLVPPQTAEAIIRVAWPAVTRSGPVAALGKAMMRTIILAPLAWLMLAPFYFKKILPFLATRYTLTNRRVMLQRGLKPKPVREVALADIDEVRIPADSVDTFYRAGTLEIVSKGEVRLTLPGVPEPEAFRHAVINACMAWVPGKAAAWLKFIPAKVEGK
jgi:Bacterial PH domain